MTPALRSYDVLLANISAGKDSQTMLRALVHAAEAAGVRDRIVAVFADLGDGDEWEGTQELAQEHADHYGVPLVVVQRRNAAGLAESLLDHIEARGMWPDAQNRYCTSDMKRDPIAKV